MSYRSLKRVLGETSLERKFLLLFGVSLLVLIAGSFWWYGRSTEQLVYDSSTESAKSLVVSILAMHHMSVWAEEQQAAQKALVFVPLRRTGTQTLQFEVPVQPGTLFAITDEPGPDGSDKPTTEVLLSGSARTA